MRTAIVAQVYREMGVEVPAGATIAQGDDPDTDMGEAQPAGSDELQRLRIPNAIARQYTAPLKWRRVDVPTPALELPLPVDSRWPALLADYNQRLHAAIRDACLAFVATDEGSDWAWRRRRPESEDFWSRDAWCQTASNIDP